MKKACALLTIFMFSGLTSFAGTECLSASDIAQISGDFKFVAKERGLKLDACDSHNRLNQVYKTLLALKNYPYHDSNPDAFDRNLISLPPYEFFKQRVHTVILESEDEPTYCAAGAAAFVDYRGKTISEIHLCPVMGRGGWVEEGSILLHESWHTNGHRHSDCIIENGAGIPACDPSYESAGSYAINTEFLVKTARNQGLHPVLRAEALSSAASSFFEHFNKKPFGITSGSLVKTKEGRLFFHHDRTMEALSVSIGAQDLVIPRLGKTLVFRAADKTLTGLDLRTNAALPKERENAELKDVMAGNTDEVLDLYMDGQVTCVLTARFSRCRMNGKNIDSAITSFKPVGFVMPEQSAILTAKATVVSADDGYLYQTDGRSPWKKSAKKMDIKDTQGVSERSDLVLLLDGRTAIYDTKKKSWTYPAEFQGLSVDKVMTPYIWSKNLDNL